MTKVRPAAEANKITKILDLTLLPSERFPVDVANVAIEYSRQVSPEDPVTKLKSIDIPGFEGALIKSPKSSEWAILFNEDSTIGRQRFTIAHEFGHYLLHRKKYPEGIRCSEEDYQYWGSEENQIEVEANEFAATLLMPLNDFRKQIGENQAVTYELLSKCSDRYGTSYTATVSRWISYTSTRSIVVCSRGGYILWARSSKNALKTGAFYKTSNSRPIEIPSMTQSALNTLSGATVLDHTKGSWLRHEACTEIVLPSVTYDISISILKLHPYNVNYPEDDRYS